MSYWHIVGLKSYSIVFKFYEFQNGCDAINNSVICSCLPLVNVYRNFLCIARGLYVIFHIKYGLAGYLSVRAMWVVFLLSDW